VKVESRNHGIERRLNGKKVSSPGIAARMGDQSRYFVQNDRGNKRRCRSDIKLGQRQHLKKGTSGAGRRRGEGGGKSTVTLELLGTVLRETSS